VSVLKIADPEIYDAIRGEKKREQEKLILIASENFSSQAVATQFMMFTVYENDEKVFEALKAGASGYLLKNTGMAQLADALRDLHSGGSPMSANIARKLVRFFRSTEKETERLETLSDRENEVLQLLAKGLLYKEIANQISISIATVRQHIHHIYEKLHVQNRTEAINKAFGKN
jgi:DNA-binding NarL/FixJ family response regulator